MERLAAPYGLAAWQFLAPERPTDTRIGQKVVNSMVHYERRKGPYNKSSKRTARP